MQGRAYRDQDYDTPEQQKMHWREFLQIFWEWKWITITSLVISATFGMIINFKAVPIYQATTSIEVESDTRKLLNIQDVLTADTRSVEYINTKLQILRSRALAEKIVKRLFLDRNPDFLPGAGPTANFAGTLQACMQAQVRRGTRIIDIIVEHRNPKVAALIANGVAQEFIKSNLENRMSASMDAVKWLSTQSEDYKKKLTQSESAVQEYREKTRDVSLEDSYNIVLDKLKSMNTAVGAAKMDRLAAETEWKQTQAALDAKQDPALIPSIASDEQVSTLHQSLVQKQMAVATLRTRYKDKYPVMVAALSELKETEDKLKQTCDAAAERIRARYLMAKAKEEVLQQPLVDTEQQALDLSRKLVAYSALKRNTESDRQLYETIMTRMKEAGVTEKMERNDLRVIDEALVPQSPVRPDKTKNLMYAIVVGLLAGFVLSYGAHVYDDKIKSYKDIEAYLGMPLLCEVPRIDAGTDFDRATVVHSVPDSLAAEAFSNLRATLRANPKAKDVRILLVTSTAPGEGKTLISSNMSIAFANDNLRTLLIDADLRHPSVGKDFQLKTELGLSQYLADGCKREDIICKTVVPNLDIIPAGVISKNPAESLGSARMRELIETMVQQYDRVIVDTPPVGVVSDAIVLLPRVQAVVYVTHFRKLRRDAVARAVKKLRETGVLLIGNVLNNIDLRKHGYYYYPYHYSYRHSYGSYYYGKTGRRRMDDKGDDAS